MKPCMLILVYKVFTLYRKKKEMGYMKAWTDISYKNKLTLFGYVITDNEDQVVQEKCYYSDKIEVGIAEDVAVALLLRDLIESGFTGKLEIGCDCKSTVERMQRSVEGRIKRRYKKLFQYISEAKTYADITIINIPRENNTLAHNLCDYYRRKVGNISYENINKELNLQEVLYSDFSVSNLPNRASFTCKKILKRSLIGGINKRTLNYHDRHHLMYEYRKLVKEEYLKDLDYIYTWASIHRCENTQEGRKRLIRQFVWHQHKEEELNFVSQKVKVRA